MPFTPLISRVSVSYGEDGSAPAPPSIDDPWDNWVFEIEGGAWLEKHACRSELAFDGSLSADRVTEEWRLRTRLSGEYEEDRFKSDDVTTRSSSHEQRFWGAIVTAQGRSVGVPNASWLAQLPQRPIAWPIGTAAITISTQAKKRWPWRRQYHQNTSVPATKAP